MSVTSKSALRIKNIIDKVNAKTGKTHTDLTSAVQTLMDGYIQSNYLYSFGALSDTHIQYDSGIDDFRRALMYLGDKVDFVCICGDLVSYASAENMAEYQLYAETVLYQPTTPSYECAGNHETYPEIGVSGEIDKSLWEETTGWANHEANGCIGDSLYYCFTKGDDIFVMLSVVDADPYAAFAEGALEWLETILETNRDKRCFVFQHVHDGNDNTADPSHVYSDMLNGDDGARFIALMKHYKNAIWFHGHTHLSISTGLDANGYKTDDYNYSPVSTELGYKSVHIPSLQGVRYYDPTLNTLVDSYKYYGSDGNTYETQGGQHAEGYIVDVYDNKIVVRGIDFAVLYYNADWTARYEVEPMEGKEFSLNTKLQTIEPGTFE